MRLDCIPYIPKARTRYKFFSQIEVTINCLHVMTSISVCCVTQYDVTIYSRV